MSLHAIATGRTRSMFLEDIEEKRDAMRGLIKGKRVLAIGAAGSIGSSTVMVLSRFEPAALHVIDQNENGLAEFVRQFRSDGDMPEIADFRTLPLDYGSAAMRYFLGGGQPYDLVLNFAAIKHVRSEKDSYSILQMLDTNIVKLARLMRWLALYSPQAGFFSVSTDKAANPASFMGATKRIMEHVMFHPQTASGFTGKVTSARFANVAFSNGSLLQSFEYRLARGEPLACPADIRRYFVSLAESGHICALAALLVPAGHIAIPRLNPEEHLVPLLGIAEQFLLESGFIAQHYENEAAAKRALAADRAQKRWPLIMTPADTAGEKPYEEFVAKGETVVDVGLKSMQAVRNRRSETGDLPGLIAALERLVAGGGEGVSASDIEKNGLKRMIAEIEPEFMGTHRESARNLDQRA
jgi:FlaA1/EpsC-like NDP-sugar epimerase